MMASYKTYLVSSAGLPRDHHSIFVETDPPGAGLTFQVTGNIQDGMRHEEKIGDTPFDSPTYVGKKLIGTVKPDDVALIKDICEAIDAPKKQFEGPRHLYPQESLRRCQEWTGEAIIALRNAGVLGADSDA